MNVLTTTFGTSSAAIICDHSAESMASGFTTSYDNFTHFGSSLYLFNHREISINHTNSFSTKELQSVGISTNLNLSNCRIAFGFQYFGYEHYKTINGNYVMAKKLSNRFILSNQLAYQYFTYAYASEKKMSLAWNIDFILFFKRLQHSFCYTRMMHRFTLQPSQHFVNETDNYLAMGIKIASTPTVNWTMESQWYTNRDVSLENISCHLGIEYLIKNYSILIGCKGLPLTPTFGFCYRYKQWKFCGAGCWQPALKPSFACDIHYIFKFNPIHLDN